MSPFHLFKKATRRSIENPVQYIAERDTYGSCSGLDVPSSSTVQAPPQRLTTDDLHALRIEPLGDLPDRYFIGLRFKSNDGLHRIFVSSFLAYKTPQI